MRSAAGDRLNIPAMQLSGQLTYYKVKTLALPKLLVGCYLQSIYKLEAGEDIPRIMRGFDRYNAWPQAGHRVHRTPQDSRDHQHDPRHLGAPPPRPPQTGAAALTSHRTR